MRSRGVVGLLAGVLLLSGCAGESAGSPAGSSTTSATATAPARETVPETAEAPETRPRTTSKRAPATPERDRVPVVVLDPGHNGGNAAAPEEINRLVPAGRGREKPCNTTGTSTDDGYPEHAFNFDVAQRVKAILTGRGIKVVSTRDTDGGVGPCVNRRADIGNKAKAHAVVSIHADGNTSPGARGFHIAYSAPPLNEAQGRPAFQLASTLVSNLKRAGFPVSNYLGEHGLDGRDDLAGMNLSTRPAVLVECGNMRDPGEAALMKSPRGRQRYAAAIATGIMRYLG